MLQLKSKGNTFPQPKGGGFSVTKPVLSDLVIGKSLRCFGCRDPEVTQASGTLVAL